MRISDWRSDVCSSDLDTPEHNAFVKAYQAKYDDYPRLGSLVGYNTILSIAAAIEKAGSTETEAIVDAFKGLQLDTPLGPITYRALDHQSTMGAWVGKTAVKDGKRSEEHTSELQSLMRISYDVFCLKKKKIPNNN